MKKDIMKMRIMWKVDSEEVSSSDKIFDQITKIVNKI